MRASSVRAASAALLALALLASPSRASIEEFQSFDALRQEEDDENLLDRVLVRHPEAWRDEWERAPNAFRTTEGCFTSGQWYIVHDLQLRTPLGKQSHMDLQLRQVQDTESVYEWLQFEFRFPVLGTGLWGVRFRPDFDKSRQDLALLWDHGDATTPLQVQAAFTIEDTFNKLWAFRQTRVGDQSEPYEVHPLEPALRVVWRHDHGRIEASGTWLTPSRKRFEMFDPALRRREELWGVKHALSIEQSFGDWRAEARFDQVQVSSNVRYELLGGSGHSFRRRSLGEVALRRRLGSRARVETRWFWQDRTQDWLPPLSNSSFHATDRMPTIEFGYAPRTDLVARIGYMLDHVSVENHGTVPGFNWGTRRESRLFVGLQARFGRVRIQGIEGVELDREAYPVTLHHDKGFLGLQTTF